MQRQEATNRPTAQRTLGLVLAAALAVAVIMPPSGAESGPILCPFRLITGLPCPGCGLTRSWVHTGHGEWSAAVADHPAGPVVLGLAVVALVWLAATRARRSFPPWLRRLGLLVAGLTVTVGVVRLALALG